MSQAPAGGEGRTEWERTLVQRSLEDEEFRQRLLDDPKGTLEQELGSALPQGLEVRVVEESADTIYLVLPSASPVGDQGGELSEEELESVAGGVGGKYTDDDATCGRACNTDICTSLSC
jgi:Nitrile hydratase, alpha chain